MGLTLLEVLVRALKKLDESSLQRFIERLSVLEVREEYTEIPKDELRGIGPEHIAGLINRYYREDYGTEVTLEILQDINEDKVREELRQDLRRAGDHFLGRRREDLRRDIKFQRRSARLVYNLENRDCESDQDEWDDLEMQDKLSRLEEAKCQEPEKSIMDSTKLSCKLCDQSQGSADVISPTMIHGTYCLSMPSPGLFSCSESGIQFQVTQPVTIEYEVDSWSNYTEILQNLHGGYEIISPLFNIKSTLKPNVVSEVYLPHCLCLGGFKGPKLLIKCFHCKDDNLVLESPSRMEAMYAVLENPTFSCIGVILYPLTVLKEGIMRRIPYHGMVLLFCNTITWDDQTYKYRLHLYLLPNILTAEKVSPPYCHYLENKFYFPSIEETTEIKIKDKCWPDIHIFCIRRGEDDAARVAYVP